MQKGLFLILICFFCSFGGFAQRKSKLNTNGKGTLLGYVSYSRTSYSTSDFSINAQNYSFTANELPFSDNADYAPVGSFFNSAETPQINFYLGYFVAHKWAVGIHVDRQNVFLAPDENSFFSGDFSPGSHSQYSGQVTQASFNEAIETINYYQESGATILQASLIRVDQWVKKRTPNFAFQTALGVKGGPVISNAEYWYDGLPQNSPAGISGFSAAIHASTRFVFSQHIFLQVGINTGLIAQNNIALNTTRTTTAEHANLFFSPEIALGFSIFARPTDGCGTCPQW